ncbi:hypothetical protein [Pedobacter psychrodurus]|uniref:hypothetical protein n=1 Tax=Pedobacter psychrodurus TaxID=2530456 RepID=UPI00292F04D7|nr:hypothetical protein [Pedobacter psychrodurus]
MEEAALFEALQTQVLAKCGIAIIYINDCSNISIQIFEQNRNYISETTIKRFFGFPSNTGQFSPFVMDSISQFIGFTNWQEFQNKQSG